MNDVSIQSIMIYFVQQELSL